MECNKDEALKAKEIAERRFESKDLQGAKTFALKAQALFPGLEGIVQLITTFTIYLASEVKIAGEKDWYSILSVDATADQETLKKQYMKLVLLLHPDKNRSVGAQGAFQMVSEAWTVLSDKTKRLLYDQKRKLVVFQQNLSQSNEARESFDTFVAKAATVNHHTYKKVKREREETRAAARREDALQEKRNPFKRQSTMLEPVNLGTANIAYGKNMRTIGKDAGISVAEVNSFRMPSGCIPFSTSSGAYESQGVNAGSNWKSRPPTRNKRSETIDRNGNLVEKMRNELREKIPQKKREEMMEKLKEIVRRKTVKVVGCEKMNAPVDPEENCSRNRIDAKMEDGGPSYTVPDPHFHDFDKDRTEKSFQSDQIWALYDEEDGMPRYYAFTKKSLSLTKFKLKISFLTSRSNSEFGPSNWVSFGFSKTCGDFRIGKYVSCSSLNMFSHQIKWEKVPRGIIKFYPHKGDIWTVYRNWSPDWNEDTPDNVLHVYDLVEILDDYDEDHGISVVPLIKVSGFRTNFQRKDLNFIKRIQKEEMFQLSHQVPFYRISGEEASNVPKDSYEVDPAILSGDLLQEIKEAAMPN